MRETSYICVLIGVCVAIVIGTAAFNWLVNPLGIYTPPVIGGLNDAHPAAQLYAFVQKVETVKRLKPDAVITGTSRAEICLDPKPEFFPGLTPYNFSLAASSVHEQRLALEFAQSVRPLKQAIITLDFFSFDARKKDNPAYDAARLEPAALTPLRSIEDTYSPLVSLDTAAASLKQIKFMGKLDRFAFTKDNGVKVPNDFAYISKTAGAAWPFTRGRFTNPDDDEAIRAIGSRALANLRAMIDFAYDNNIDARFLILPLHQSYFDMLKKTGQDDFVRKWASLVRKALRDSASAHHKPQFTLWDFGFRHAYSNEAVPKPEDKTTQMKWFWDPGHCKAALGDVILQRMRDEKTAEP